MDKFLKIQNFKLCQDAFGKWMKNVYGFDVTGEDKQLFETMTKIKAEYIGDSSLSLTELNNMALNRLQDEFVTTHQLKKLEKNTMLDRDMSAFGTRPSVAAMSFSLPQNTTNRDYGNVNSSFDTELMNRNPDSQQQQQLPPQCEPEKPIPSDVFEKLLNTHRKSLETDIELKLPLVPDDPQVLYKSMPISAADLATPSVYTTASPIFDNDNTKNLSGAFMEQPTERQIVKKYITMNGFDREWTVQKKRCNFSINLTQFSATYKNIASIRMTKLIIPNEIIEHRSILNMPKFQHHHDQKLAYPYLCLQVDEISGVCDGVNQAIQKSFTQFVYESSYKCPNGRGYVILEPAQKETKVFYPQCLSSLQRLTFSITKPNGTLFNNNNDDYNILKVEYELYNNLYIKIWTDKYFDKNEFYVGDHIQLTGYNMYKPASAPVTSNSGDFEAMARFVCRPQGHEIVQLGNANENGFYKSFYVLGPCVMDQSIGKLVIDKDLVETLKEYNMATCHHHAEGQMINLSLQMTISMTIGIDVADRSLLLLK